MKGRQLLVLLGVAIGSLCPQQAPADDPVFRSTGANPHGWEQETLENIVRNLTTEVETPELLSGDILNFLYIFPRNETPINDDNYVDFLFNLIDAHGNRYVTKGFFSGSNDFGGLIRVSLGSPAFNTGKELERGERLHAILVENREGYSVAYALENPIIMFAYRGVLTENYPYSTLGEIIATTQTLEGIIPQKDVSLQQYDDVRIVIQEVPGATSYEIWLDGEKIGSTPDTTFSHTEKGNYQVRAALGDSFSEFSEQMKGGPREPNISRFYLTAEGLFKEDIVAAFAKNPERTLGQGYSVDIHGSDGLIITMLGANNVRAGVGVIEDGSLQLTTQPGAEGFNGGIIQPPFSVYAFDGTHLYETQLVDGTIVKGDIIGTKDASHIFEQAGTYEAPQLMNVRPILNSLAFSADIDPPFVYNLQASHDLESWRNEDIILANGAIVPRLRPGNKATILNIRATNTEMDVAQEFIRLVQSPYQTNAEPRYVAPRVKQVEAGGGTVVLTTVFEGDGRYVLRASDDLENWEDTPFVLPNGRAFTRERPFWPAHRQKIPVTAETPHRFFQFEQVP